jgi:hypothetical protein
MARALGKGHAPDTNTNWKNSEKSICCIVLPVFWEVNAGGSWPLLSFFIRIIQDNKNILKKQFLQAAADLGYPTILSKCKKITRFLSYFTRIIQEKKTIRLSILLH